MALDRIYVTLEGHEAVLADFVAKPGQIARASRRAVQKVTRSVGGVLARELAREHKLPLSIFGAGAGRGRRVRFSRGSSVTDPIKTGQAAVGTIWIGHRPIKASHLGTPRQTRTGARAGKHLFERAFVATTASGHTTVFKRTGRSRLPIEEQTVSLDKSGDIIDRIAATIPARLADLLRQELNYEVNVRGR